MNAPSKKPAAETLGDQLASMDKQRTDNLRIWSRLSKTDPAHTKGFKRAGGFSGTAIKPIWITQRLTEQFGPCGVGWGFERPEFQLVTVGNETLVYCTVTAWFMDGGKQHFIYGVGGDKVAAARQSGVFTDDEAFKKAFTDALGNAFKFIGVAADVHMGLFEDSKYLAQITAEFNPPANNGGEDKGRKDGDMSASALKGSLRMLVHHINGCGSVEDLEQVLDTEDAKEVMENCERRFPAWFETGEGMPAEFVPLKTLIDQTRKGLKQLETQDV